MALGGANPAETSRTAVSAWIVQGRVLVDGRPTAGKTKMKGGEEVEIHIPPPAPTGIEPEARDLAILHEDDALLVLDKPSGLTVHPGTGRRGGTLANALVHRWKDLPEAIGSDRPGIVHRLDKDTSGVMVVAKTETVQRALSTAFAARRVTKEYVAVVHGLPASPEGTIDQPIGRSPAARTKMTVVSQGGRASVTRWKVERPLPRHAVLRCFPVTGRTHQIRVHLRWARLPIVGDPIYGTPSGPADDLPGRLMLHAQRLAFDHPVTRSPVAFEAPLPADFVAGVEGLASLAPAPPRRR